MTASELKLAQKRLAEDIDLKANIESISYKGSLKVKFNKAIRRKDHSLIN